MFGKKDLVDLLSHDLDRARARRDVLASGVTTLAAQIAELEARLFEERNRRERERIEAEIDQAQTRLEDASAKFAPAIARLCEATATTMALVPEACELNALLTMVATEVTGEIEKLLSELRRMAETVAACEMAPPVPAPAAKTTPQRIGDRVPLLLPAFLPRNSGGQQNEPPEHRHSTAA